MLHVRFLNHMLILMRVAQACQWILDGFLGFLAFVVQLLHYSYETAMVSRTAFSEDLVVMGLWYMCVCVFVCHRRATNTCEDAWLRCMIVLLARAREQLLAHVIALTVAWKYHNRLSIFK